MSLIGDKIFIGLFSIVLHRGAQLIAKKLNWSCTACGMSSGRKFSVQRHIQNYNIHNGAGQVIPFIQYAVGTREGKYRSQQVPKNSNSQSQFLDGIYVKIAHELENLIVNDIAKRIFSDISLDQANFYKLKSQAVAYIFEKNYYRFFKESIS